MARCRRKGSRVTRPREFNEEKVLDKITMLFWEKGFESTSLNDIIDASGLNKGSLYSCFGNKEKLFQLALENYAVKGPFHPFQEFESPLQKLAAFYSKLVTVAVEHKQERRGCFVFNSCLEFANKKGRLASFVSNVGRRNESFFHELMNEAKGKGELSEKVNPTKAADRAHATAFTIQEMSKFKPDKEFLSDIANSFFESIGATERILHRELL